MKPLECKSTTLSREKENHKFIQHVRESQNEGLTWGEVDSILHLKISQEISNKDNKHEVELSWH